MNDDGRGRGEDAGARGDTTLLYEQDGERTYRLPSLFCTGGGTLLAACQKRKGERGDWAESALVMKRSTDGGRTWGREQSLYEVEGECTFTGNLLEDRRTNTIFALFIAFPRAEGAGWFEQRWIPAGGGFSLIKSREEGRTWSERADHIPEPNPDGWRGGAAYNNTHGIQLSEGPNSGRLVAAARVFKEGSYRGRCKGGLAYSDDGGESWTIGAVGRAREGPVNGEVTLCEDGNEVYVNFRSRDTDARRRRRFYARSRDGGASFYEEGECAGIPAHGCHAGLESMQSRGGGRRCLLLSYPRSGYTPDSSREDLMLWVSGDGGRSFMDRLLIKPGPAAYSDMVRLGGQAVGILWEGGCDHRYQSIGFTRLDLGEWEGWCPQRREGTPAAPSIWGSGTAGWERGSPSGRRASAIISERRPPSG